MFVGAWERIESVRQWRVAREALLNSAKPVDADRAHAAALWAAIPVAVRRCIEASLSPQLDRREWPTGSLYWQLLAEASDFARQAEQNLPAGHPLRQLMQPRRPRGAWG